MYDECNNRILCLYVCLNVCTHTSYTCVSGRECRDITMLHKVTSLAIHSPSYTVSLPSPYSSPPLDTYATASSCARSASIAIWRSISFCALTCYKKGRWGGMQVKLREPCIYCGASHTHALEVTFLSLYLKIIFQLSPSLPPFLYPSISRSLSNIRAPPQSDLQTFASAHDVGCLVALPSPGILSGNIRVLSLLLSLLFLFFHIFTSTPTHT